MISTRPFLSKLTPTIAISERLGATPDGEGRTRFLLWAPHADQCEVHLVHPAERYIQMDRLENGYFGAVVDNCDAGARYFFRLNGESEHPGPTSRYQPYGVHGPSEVTARRSPGLTAWQTAQLADYIIYELHIGTFTHEGTFNAAISQLDRLKDLGMTAIEIMPVAEFPGSRNWGYDGAYLYAVHSAYGGPEAMGRFVDACHERGLAVILDVVYNHLGPEGNYLRQFGPYFTDRYRTPWGDAINFDGPHSDEVRRFFIGNALCWIEEFGVDALRLDAVHAIFDQSARPFLTELGERVRAQAQELGRQAYLIAESDLNDSRLVTPVENGGIGINAQWADDLHHSLHSVLTGEKRGYYADYGRLDQVAKSLHLGWTYTGEYSRVRQRRFGNSPEGIDPSHLIVCSQNHDQVGNRMMGERLIELAGRDAARLAAAAVILSPYTPLLFMGEEYGETAPFLYFVSHTDSWLQEAVRTGRKAEFAEFHSVGEPPDPQAVETFRRSKLNHAVAVEGMQAYYGRLIQIRRNQPAFRPSSTGRHTVECLEKESVVLFRRSAIDEEAVVLLHFGKREQKVSTFFPRGTWSKLLDSSEPVWGGPGSVSPDSVESFSRPLTISLPALSCVVYVTTSK